MQSYAGIFNSGLVNRHSDNIVMETPIQIQIHTLWLPKKLRLTVIGRDLVGQDSSSSQGKRSLINLIDRTIVQCTVLFSSNISAEALNASCPLFSAFLRLILSLPPVSLRIWSSGSRLFRSLAGHSSYKLRGRCFSALNGIINSSFRAFYFRAGNVDWPVILR